jgi:hypothetical protein
MVEESPEAEGAPPPAEESHTIDDDLQHMREMLRGEAAAAAGKAPKRKGRGFFGRRRGKQASWGPKQGPDEETNRF